MHPCNYSKPRDANESGKFASTPTLGVHRFDNHGYKSHKYEISSRQIGLTVKRTSYSVTIYGETGLRLAFLTDIPSAEGARKAAESWIDRDCLRRPKPHRAPRPKHLPVKTPAGETPLEQALPVEQAPTPS